MPTLQVYACAKNGQLVHAAPHDFLDSIPFETQCRTLELVWRRWRDRYIADWTPRWPSRRKWRQARDYPAPIDDRHNAVVYHLIDPNTGRPVTPPSSCEI